MKKLLTFSFALASLCLSVNSYAGNVAYIHGDISEAGFTPASSATTGSTEPYDQMLLTDTGDTGLSRFKTIVEEQGHTIEQYYDEATVLDDIFLSDKDVIVFGLHQKIWSSAEKNALDSWLRQGGGMLIYSDSASGGFHRIVGAQNSVGQMASNNLISAYGIEVMVDQANGAPRIAASTTASIAELRGLTLEAEGVSPIAFSPDDDNLEVLIPYSGPIRTTAGLTIENPDYAALALKPVGQGHIMALFDRQPIWNNGNGANIQDGDNSAIFRILINFLAERPDDAENLNPTVVIDAPNEAENFTLNDTVNITVTATDADGSISKVDFFLNGDTLVGSDTTAPYTASFQASTLGNTSIAATATDNEGATATDQVSIVVNEDVIVPPVQLREPTVPSSPLVNGVEYQYFKSVRVSSTSELVGEPYAVGLLPAGPSVSPALNDSVSIDYGFIFNGYINVPEDGVYTFYTTSDDGSDLYIGDQEIVNNDGNHGAQERFGDIGLEAGLHPITIRYFQGRSLAAFEYAWQGPNFSKQEIPADVWFTEEIQPVGNVGPQVAFSQPVNNANFTVGELITIVANANDLDGTISQVEFSLNGNTLNTDSSTPYTSSFTPSEAGNYTLRVVAQDDDGATNSDQISVIVNPVVISPPSDLRQPDVPANDITNGVEYDYFRITRPTSTTQLVGEPYESGILLSGPSIAPALSDSRSIDYGFVYRAYISVPENGIYTFYTTSDDGSDLFIGDEKIVDNDGSHAAQERSGQIGLEAGLHLITIRYFQGRSSSAFEYAWQGPSFSKQEIPADVWFIEEAQTVPPVDGLRPPATPSNDLESGINYDFFKINRPTSTSQLVGEPFESGKLPSGPSVTPAIDDSTTIDYGFIFTGYIDVPEDGMYTFYTTSDDGSDLFIGGERIVDNDGSHGAQERSGQIGLQAGIHPITIRYFQGRSSSFFEYAWQGPSFNKQEIPGDVWFIETDQEPVTTLRQPVVLNETLVSGVAYDFFRFIRVDSTSELVGSPYASGLLPLGPSLSPAVDAANATRDFGFIYRGYIEIPESGTYTFFTTSDDGSDLFIGDEKIVDNDGNHGAQERSGRIGLQAGLHPITIRYFQGLSSFAFEYAWQGPSISKQAIPSHVWFVESN